MDFYLLFVFLFPRIAVHLLDCMFFNTFCIHLSTLKRKGHSRLMGAGFWLLIDLFLAQGLKFNCFQISLFILLNYSLLPLWLSW